MFVLLSFNNLVIYAFIFIFLLMRGPLQKCDFRYCICRPLRLELSPEEEVVVSMHIDVIRSELFIPLTF